MLPLCSFPSFEHVVHAIVMKTFMRQPQNRFEAHFGNITEK